MKESGGGLLLKTRKNFFFGFFGEGCLCEMFFLLLFILHVEIIYDLISKINNIRFWLLKRRKMYKIYNIMIGWLVEKDGHLI